MSTKFLIFVVGTFLLVKCAHGNAIGEKPDSSLTEGSNEMNMETNKSNEKLSFKEKNDATGLKFFVNAISEMIELVELTYDSTRAAFEPIITNIDATGNNSRIVLVNKLKKVKAAFEKASKLEEDDQLENGDFFQELSSIFGALKKAEKSTTNLSELNRDLIKVQEKLKAEAVESIKLFSDRIVIAAEKYWNSMSAIKQQEEQKFYDIYMKIKNEPDLERKVDLLKNLMSFDDSSEENQ